MGTSNYEKLTDEQLIRNLRDGDKKIMDYIMEKYKTVVRKEAKAMYLIGGENDDLIQEGMIGLFKAVRDYDTEQEVSMEVLPDCASEDRCTARQKLPVGRSIYRLIPMCLFTKKRNREAESMCWILLKRVWRAIRSMR